MTPSRQITQLAPSVATPVAVLGLLLIAPPAHAQVEDLGSIVDRNARPIAISANGRTAIGLSTTTTRDVAFRFTDADGFEVLETLNGADAYTVDVSDDGTYVVGNVSNSRAVRWTNASAPQDLGSLGSFFTEASAISGDGSTVVGRAVTSGLSRHAFRWTEAGGMVDIHPAFGVGDSRAFAVSADGTAVVGLLAVNSATGASAIQAFLWTESAGAIDLGTGVAEESRGLDISADGTVVTGIGRFGTPRFQPFVWTAATGMVPLGEIGASNFVSANVSADGSTVFGYDQPAGYRWTASGGLQLFTGDPHFVPFESTPAGDKLVGLFALGTSGIDGPATWTASTGAIPLSMPFGNAAAIDITADGSAILGDWFPGGGQHRAGRWRSDGTIGSIYCDPATANSVSATGAALTLGGSNRRDDAMLRLSATSLPPNSFGFIIGSFERDLVSMPGGSQGTVCLGGSIGRFVGPGQIMNAGPSGAFTLTVDPATFPSPLGPIVPAFGETWNFQAWYRDANPLPTSNFSSAATVSIF